MTERRNCSPSPGGGKGVMVHYRVVAEPRVCFQGPARSCPQLCLPIRSFPPGSYRRRRRHASSWVRPRAEAGCPPAVQFQSAPLTVRVGGASHVTPAAGFVTKQPSVMASLHRAAGTVATHAAPPWIPTCVAVTGSLPLGLPSPTSASSGPSSQTMLLLLLGCQAAGCWGNRSSVWGKQER